MLTFADLHHIEHSAPQGYTGRAEQRAASLPGEPLPLVWGGEYWPDFRTVPGLHADGRPAIICKPLGYCKSGDSFIITVERWLSEIRTGGIVPR